MISACLPVEDRAWDGDAFFDKLKHHDYDYEVAPLVQKLSICSLAARCYFIVFMAVVTWIAAVGPPAHRPRRGPLQAYAGSGPARTLDLDANSPTPMV